MNGDVTGGPCRHGQWRDTKAVDAWESTRLARAAFPYR
ncbi:hypothetical protein FRUB_01563 [Fimbriiglobus ruber]|uniref:Uncharacterized protein n=1 Tax=Fimbriiglobus ruber TaxID=1908690 RepID=A0A225DV53_9BACT|nr:hypothetical protein FRUB_01563 [Fimbriiglobus ruber]